MKEKSNNNLNILLGGLAAVGLTVGGLSLASKNAETAQETNIQTQTESVLNLPATNEKVNGLENRLESAIDQTNAQINRRELEMRAERDKLLDDLKRVQDLDRERIKSLEEKVYELTKKH